ncbi:THAP domain-containing protein 3 isoform X4 [Zalophus californianus]|uniref:THAP domain-containing protein 3 isoform X4 n=1 Tax=Zalophus californianus TaxID=9704 RepID=A0A6J2E639_ZALCA|nr:THAP domain-containing protein 3 isoform X4 [Zalophus californianus]
MPKSCAARQCCNRYSSRRKQLTFHRCSLERSRFPFSRPELLKEWVLNIGRGNFKPKQHTVICSEHFRPECFSAFGNRKNLKQNAVPTVFAFQDAAQLVRESADLAGEDANVDSYKEEGLPQRLQGISAPRPPASPTQPSDHSYALLDLDALKTKLFLTLKENEKLRKRLKAQRLVIQRMSSRLRAHRAGQPGLQARPRPEPQSRAGRPGFPVSASGARATDPEGTARQARPTTSHLRGGVAASARDRNGTVGRADSVLPEGTGADCPSNESWAGVFSTTV